jgi:hypothetical protein
MPDLRAADAHIRALTALESRLAQELDRTYAALRSALQEALASTGARGVREGLPTALRSAQASMRRHLATAAGQVAQRSEAFASDELVRLSPLVDVALSAAPAVASTATAQVRLSDAEITRALQWLDGIGGLILAEATRLEVTAAPPEVATARLLAPGLAGDGRASLWRQGRSRLDLAVTDFVFGLDNGGRSAIYQAAEPRGQRFAKQAIAAVDRRTTQCCLNVHGQIRPLDAPFDLSGTPQFAPQLMQPPFHWRCRTVMVLYHPAMEAVGPATAALRASARQEARSR